MIVCGAALAGSEVVLVWIDSHSTAFVTGAKVRLDDPYSKTDTGQSADIIRRYLAENRTDLLAIKTASTSGKYPAGHVSFRLETLMLQVSPCDVIFVSPQTKAAKEKKRPIEYPGGLHKYQHDAYATAVISVND